MQNKPLQAGSFILGGLSISVWLYLILFRVPILPLDGGAWTFWGIVGLAIAGGIYGARITGDKVRIAIWIAIGIAAGFLAMAALFQQAKEAFAALFTFVGGGLIATALPGPQWTEVEG